jgi:hypothetical protein
MRRQLVGAMGAIFAELCCIGTPALLAFLASIGAGFFIDDVILLPLLMVFLVVTIWGMRRTRDAHGQREPLLVTVISSVVIVALCGFPALWRSSARPGSSWPLSGIYIYTRFVCRPFIKRVMVSCQKTHKNA